MKILDKEYKLCKQLNERHYIFIERQNLILDERHLHERHTEYIYERHL